MSMGGITAIAAVAVLGDGSMPGADADLAAPAHVAAPKRPRIVAVIADSVAPDLAAVGVPLMPGPRPRYLADRLFDAAARTLGGDPRETEPIRVIGLLEGVHVLLISGDRDPIVPLADARRLAAAAPQGSDQWIVPGAGHRRGASDGPGGLRDADRAPLADRVSRRPRGRPIIGPPAHVPVDPADFLED